MTDLSVCQWRLTKKIQHVFLECEQFKVDRGISVCCVEMQSTCKVKEMANGIRLSGQLEEHELKLYIYKCKLLS